MTLFTLIALIAGAFLIFSVVFDGVLDALDLDIGDGFVSLTSVSGAATMFGLGGIFAESALDTSRVVALAVGASAGVLTLAGVGALVRYLKKPEPEFTITVIGAHGRVTTPARAEGFGEVSVMINGHPVKLTARSQSDLTLGQSVEVTESLSATSVRVRPINL